MHIPWGWIKQRPQFLAEALNEYYKVDVIDYRSGKSGILNATNVRLLDICRLYLGKSKVLNKLKRVINFALVKGFIFLNYKQYDYIWLTNSNLIRLLPRNFNLDCKLIYDHMDDYSEFDMIKNNPRLSRQTKHFNNITFSLAKYIFCSSESLHDNLKRSYPDLSKRMITVYNALDYRFFLSSKPVNSTQNLDLKNKLHQIKASKTKIIMYVGTIDTWFDFELIKSSLNQISDIIYVLVGPNTAGYEPGSGIMFIGAVEHDCLYEIMQYADIFIMPFKVNKLIESVDPVKIYEYIAVGKPILIPKYPEVEKFAMFTRDIYYYIKATEYVLKLQDLVCKDGLPAGTVRNSQFIKDNSWFSRALQIKKYLD